MLEELLVVLLLVSCHCNIFQINILYSKTDSSSNSDSGNGLPIPIIAGAGGGAVLFLIILFCVVLLCCKWRLRKKKTYSISTIHSNADAQSGSKNGL